MKRSAKKGFTLIELIIVIAILAILAMVIVPRITGIRGNAQAETNRTNAKSLQNALDQYYGEQGYYPGGAASLTAADLKKALAPYLKDLPKYKSGTYMVSTYIPTKGDAAETVESAAQKAAGYKVTWGNDPATNSITESDTGNNLTPGVETANIFKN